MPALGLIWAPISFVLKNVVPFFRYHEPYRITVNYPILVGDLFVLLLVGIVSYFFFTRRKLAPVLYIIEILIVSAMWNLMDGLVETQNDPPLTAMIFGCMVLVPYFTLSKRVRATFDVELDASNPVDRVALRIAPALDRFYAALRRAGRWVILLALAYVILTILANCATRAIRIDGTITRMFEYL